jgi:hypothetical protein
VSTITYDVNKINASIAGIPLKGGGESAFIAFAYDEDAWTKKVGCDGEATRSRMNNDGGKFTVTCMQTSRINAILQSLYLADKEGGLGVVPFNLFDPSTGLEYFSEDAWVMKGADNSWEKESGEREWIIDCGKVTEVPVEPLLDLLSGLPTV